MTVPRSLPHGCDSEHGYGEALAHTLSACGWTFSEHHERPVPGAMTTIPRWEKGSHVIEVARLAVILRDHPWCRKHMDTALANGAVGFSVAITDGPDGKWTAHFEPTWPDAVTRLGELSEPDIKETST